MESAGAPSSRPQQQQQQGRQEGEEEESGRNAGAQGSGTRPRVAVSPIRAPTPRMNLMEEVEKGRKSGEGERRRDFDRWMRREEPRGFRAGTQDFRDNVTVIRERAGVLAAEEDRKRLGEEEFRRRFEARQARFGGAGASVGDERRDSGVASVGDEVGDEVDEEDVVIGDEERPERMEEEEVQIVREEGPKKLAFSMKELERQLEKKGEGSRAKVGRGTPPCRGDMISWLLSVDEEALAATWGRKTPSSEEGGSSGRRSSRAEREVEKRSTGERDGKGKGKGKSSKKREKEAEERHVRRQEEGRSK